jgi:hypothetical protein
MARSRGHRHRSQARQAAPGEDELRALIKDRLRSSHVPERIAVLDALPYNEMGKLLRREVRALFRNQPSSSARRSTAPHRHRFRSLRNTDRVGKNSVSDKVVEILERPDSGFEDVAYLVRGAQVACC